jgi:hypothetical protein
LRAKLFQASSLPSASRSSSSRSAKDGIIHLVFPSRRGMLPGVRATIDFLAAALKAQA